MEKAETKVGSRRRKRPTSALNAVVADKDAKANEFRAPKSRMRPASTQNATVAGEDARADEFEFVEPKIRKCRTIALGAVLVNKEAEVDQGHGTVKSNLKDLDLATVKKWAL